MGRLKVYFHYNLLCSIAMTHSYINLERYSLPTLFDLIFRSIDKSQACETAKIFTRRIVLYFQRDLSVACEETEIRYVYFIHD
jgi:hypothetical protein